MGRIIEELPKDAFRCAGFAVEPTGIGSDSRAAIASGKDPVLEEQDVGVLRISPWYQGNSVEFLIEVKATRADSVRMSWIQADMAANNIETYVLCVVDFAESSGLLNFILKEDEPSSDSIRNCIKLVPSIGASLATAVQSLSSAVQTRNPGIEVEKAQEFRFRILRPLWAIAHNLEEWAESVRDQFTKN